MTRNHFVIGEPDGEAAVQQDERDGEEREPDVAFEPGLQSAYFQRRAFATQAEQGGEHKDGCGNSAKD